MLNIHAAFQTLKRYQKLGFKLFSLALLFMMATTMVIAQTAATGDYRSAVTTGNWGTAASWQVRDASGNWTTPSAAPTASNNVYIQAGHTITVNVATATCKDLHLNVQGVLAVGANTVEISGKIRSYGGLQISGGVLTSNVATITTTAAHPFTTGQSITIVGLSSSLAVLNGTQTIASTPTSTTFTIAKTNADIASNTASQVYPAAVLLTVLSAAVTSGVDGAFYTNQTTSGNGTGVVNSTMCTGTQGAGSLKFVGSTRNITATGEWSSVFPFFPIDVNFALNSGHTGTLLTPFHGSAVTISSGIVATSLRFLSSKTSSTGGDLTIKTGATLQSSVSGSTQIVCKSSSNKAGTFTIESGATLELAGISPTIAVTSIVNNGTISYSRSGTQNLLASSGDATAIAPTTYNNLTFAGTNTKTALANITVNGTLTVNSGVTFSMSTFDFGGTPSSVANSGTITTSSLSTTPFTSGINWGTSGVVNYAATTGGQTVIAGNYFNLTLSNTSGTNTLASTGTIGIAGAFTPGTQAATIAGSTINYNNATGGQTVIAFNYHNLTIGNTSGNTTLASSGTIGVAGSFSPGSQSVTITGSTINYNNSTGGQTVAAFNYQNLTVSNASGTTTLASSGTIGIAGTFTPGSQAFVNTGSTINFSSASGQTIPIFSYNNITLSQTSTSSTLAGTINVAGTLTIAGSKALTVGSGSVVYGAGSTFKLNGTSSQAIVTGSLEWPATNGPTNVTVNANNLTFTASAGISRTITGTLTLDGGSLGINVSNTLVMANGSTIARMQTGSGLSFSSGTLSVGTSASGVVNVIIGATMTSAGELGSTPSPGGWGILTINAGTYTLSGGRTVTGLVNNGVLAIGTTNTFNINGNISGSGTITGDVTSNLVLGGSGSGSIGTLNLTSGAQSLNNLTINRSGATLTLGTPITLAGNLALTAGTLADGGNNIPVGGTISGTGTHSGTGKIIMSGASKSISGVTLANLEIAVGSSTTTLTGAPTINGNLTLTSGTLADAGFTINLAGNIAGTATHSGAGKIVMSGDSKTISGVSVGNLEIASSGTITASAAFAITGGLTLTSGTLADGGNTITLSGGISGTGTHSGTGKIQIIVGGNSISAVTLSNVEIATTSGTTSGPTSNPVGPTINNLTLTSGGFAGSCTIVNTLVMNGGSYGVGNGSVSGTPTLTFSNNSTFIRNSTSGSFSLINTSGAVIKWGTAATDLVNLTINATASNGAEINGSETPGKIGTLTIGSGATYTWTSSRNVTNLVNNGILSITGSGCEIKGSISGTGTITSTTATLTFSGSNNGNAGTLSLTSGSTLTGLTINRTGTNASVTIGSPISLLGNLSLTAGTLNDGGNTITIAGNVSNTGTHVSTGSGKLLLTGTATSPGISSATLGNVEINTTGTYTCASSPTITGNLTLTAGTLADNSKTITVQGNLSGTATHSGTGKILLTGTNKTLSATNLGNLEIAGTITATTDISIAGNLTLTSGILTDGGNTLTIGGNLAAPSGTLSSTGKVLMTATAASVSVAGLTYNNLELNNNTNGFSLSGSGTVNGTLTLTAGVFTVGSSNVLTMANNSTIVRAAGSFSGTPNYGTTSTDVVNITINNTCNLGTELPSTPVNGKAGTLTIANGVSYTITGGRTITNLANSGLLILTPGTTFTLVINGTISGAGTITGHPNASINYGGTSATLNFTSGAQFANTFTVNCTGTLTLGTPVSINGTLNLTNGVLNNTSNNITLPNGGTINRVAGSITAAPVFTTSVNITYNGTSAQVTGPELPTSNTVINNFSVSNSAGVTLNGSATVNGVYSFSSGKIILGNNNLTFGSGVTFTGTPSGSKYIVINGTGTFTRKAVGNTATYFPIGSATSFTPLTITNTTGTSDLTTSVANTFANAPLDATKMANVQWSVVGSSATTATILFQYNSTDKASGYNVGTNDLGIFTNSAFYAISVITTSGTSTITGTKTGIAIPATGNNYLVIGNTGAVETLFTTWTGAVSTNWNTAGNWDNGVPVTGIDAVIASTGRQPILTGTQSVNKLTINSGATLTNNGTLNIASTFGNNGTITGTGTTQLNGSTVQSIIGTGTVGSFTINNTGGASVSSGSNKLNITGVLTLQLGTFTTNSNVVLKSTSISKSGTLASVGTGGNSGTISGTVSVERFIPKGYRAWRDVAPGVYNAGSIFNNWQEAGSYANAGYGLFITGTTAANASHAVDGTTGLDQTTNSVKSAYTFTAGTWSAITNTKNTTLNPFLGYRLLVRGDRTANLYTTPVSTVGTTGWLLMYNATAIRATGTLITGNVVYSTSGITNGVAGSTYNNASFGLNSSSTTGFSSVANPYVAPIDWKNIWDNNRAVNLTANYYYLDPTLGSAGAYVSYNAITDATSNGAIGSRRYIQAGQAFFVENNNSTAPSLTITEADKATSTTKTTVFGASATRSSLAINLMKATGSEFKLMDGATLIFDQQFSNGIGKEDARKMTNPGENLAINHNGLSLSIEGRQPAVANESLPLSLTQLASGNYQLSIDASAYKAENMDVYLVDAVDNRETLLSAGINNHNFTVDASNQATFANRFSVVFKSASKAATYAAPTASSTLNVYPNPMVGKTVTVRMGSEAPIGRYVVSLTNSLGQQVHTAIINHSGANAAETITTTSKMAAGVYQLNIKSCTTNKVVATTSLAVE